MKWYLDFGHGGKDSGAVGSNGKKESDMVLKIGMIVKSILEEAFEKVITTREEDKFYSLSYRTTKANNENCDYFVSIHMNSSKNKSAQGTETWIYDTNNKICKLATNLSSNLSNKLNTPNRGVKVSKNFSVLKHSKMPAVIIEIDFISNDSVEASCSDEMYIRNAANTIASTLLEFANKKIENEGLFYMVCIGAFNIKDNAVKLRNEAISKGFKDTYIIN